FVPGRTGRFPMCVTYSGHNPFIIPEADKRIHFSDTIPVRMRDFMTVANYTDYAIGTFVKGIGVIRNLLIP
ncbi:MAG: hypothetical protein V8S95_11805, partial [Odoribacter sp.]